MKCPRLLRYALCLAILFGLAHVLGWRHYTSVLAGAAPFPAHQQLMGTIYLILYATVIILAPILAIASGLLALFRRCNPASPSPRIIVADSKNISSRVARESVPGSRE